MLDQLAFSMDDQQLLRQVAAGDDQAFADFYQRYEVPLFNYLLRLVRDPAVAEELLQEVFLAVWRGAGRFSGRSKVRTWLFRIAHNQAVSWLRRNHPVVSNEGVLESLSDNRNPEKQALEAWHYDQVQRALESLSFEHREVLELAFYYNLPYAEIAAIIDVPLGTVKSRISYARRYLSKTLDALKDND